MHLSSQFTATQKGWKWTCSWQIMKSAVYTATFHPICFIRGCIQTGWVSGSESLCWFEFCLCNWWAGHLPTPVKILRRTWRWNYLRSPDNMIWALSGAQLKDTEKFHRQILGGGAGEDARNTPTQWIGTGWGCSDGKMKYPGLNWKMPGLSIEGTEQFWLVDRGWSDITYNLTCQDKSEENTTSLLLKKRDKTPPGGFCFLRWLRNWWKAVEASPHTSNWSLETHSLINACSSGGHT